MKEIMNPLMEDEIRLAWNKINDPVLYKTYSEWEDLKNDTSAVALTCYRAGYMDAKGWI